MKLEILTILTLLAAANAHAGHQARHHQLAKRQAPGVSSSGASSAASASSGVPAATSTGASSAPAATGVSSAPAGSQVPAGSSSATSAAPSYTGTLPTAPAGVSPLNQITSGMPAPTTYPLTATFTPGQSPSYSGALPLPTQFIYSPSEWPQMDHVPPTDSPQVQEWMKELEGVDIPDLQPTKDGSCGSDPAFSQDAQNRGWWTCGGWTRPTDIVACPDKNTWGVSFDDGPSPYTPQLLKYLDEKDIKATFFVVGSRVISRPQTLLEEYMAGHEISVHTWSHHALTTLTNDEIVAELGWCRESIRRVLGVTPTTMRPPFGDIDDRVRAIAVAMGLTPIIWTSTPTGGKFDTNDWRVASGDVTGIQQYQTFQNILGNASLLDTGFIVLQHDLYPETVELAVGYTLNAALTHNPAFDLKPIGECLHLPAANMYMETTTNQTYKAQRAQATAHQDTSKASSTGGTGSGSSQAGGVNKSGATRLSATWGMLVAAALVLIAA